MRKKLKTPVKCIKNRNRFPFRGVYFIFDPLKWKKCPWERNLPELFPFICAIQLRSPSQKKEETLRSASILKELIEKTNIPLIINNFPSIASRVGAYGVHLGEKDMGIKDAKNIFGGIIGASRHTVAGAASAAAEGASYIGAGPVFTTSTKETGRRSLGPEAFKKIKESVQIPVIPVGGINPSSRKLLRGISDIVAVSGAVNESENPIRAVRQLS